MKFGASTNTVNFCEKFGALENGLSTPSHELNATHVINQVILLMLRRLPKDTFQLFTRLIHHHALAIDWQQGLIPYQHSPPAQRGIGFISSRWFAGNEVSAVHENDLIAQQPDSVPDSFLSWLQIQHEMEKWKSEPSTAESVAAVFRPMSRLGLIPLDFNLNQLTEHAEQHLGNFDPETISLIYYLSCKSQVGGNEFLAKIADSILQDRESKFFGTKQLVQLLYGSGWLIKHQRNDARSGRYPQSPMIHEVYPGMDKFVDQISRDVTAPERLLSLKEQDLSNIIYSLGLLRYSTNEVLYPLLRQMEKPQFLPRYLEQELANMLLGMASLGLAGHPTVAVLAGEVVERERLRMYKEPELCSIFYSLAKLEFRNQDVIEILLKEAIRTARLSSYREHNLSNLLFSFDQLDIQDERSWRMLLKELTYPERLPKYEPHHLANILYAIGKCAYGDIHVLEALMDEVCKSERVDKFSTREYSLMLYGLSRIGYSKPSVLKLMSEELGKDGRLKEGDLPQKTLSGILLSFATLRHRDEKLIQQFFQDVLQKEKLEQMHPEVLSQYIYALGKFKTGLSPQIKDVVRCLIQDEEKLNKLSLKGLGMVIYGLGQFGPQMSPSMKPILDILKSGISTVERFSVQELGMIVYSLGQLRLEDYEITDRMLNAFCRPDRIFKASTQSLSNLVYGLGLLRFPIKESSLLMLETELVKPSRLRSYTSQELANLIFSFGMLQNGNRPQTQHTIEKLTDEVIKPERLSQFREMELNCILSGLSYLEHRDARILVPLLEEISQENRLRNLKDPEISSIIHVIAQLGICPDEICGKLLLEAKKPERLERYDLKAMVMMVYSLGRLQNSNYPEAIQAFSKKLLQSPLVGQLSEGHLTHFFYGVANAKYDSPEVLKMIFEEITKHQRLPQYQCGEILNIMKAILALRNRNVEVEGLDHVARIFAIEMTAASRFELYSPSQLTQVLQVLSVLRNKNVATAFPILKELTRQENLHRLTPLDVSRAIFAVGPLAFVNRQLHPRLALAAKPLLKQVVLGREMEAMGCHTITELLVGMSMLGLKDPYLLDNLTNEIVKPMRLRSFRAWHLSRIFYAIAQLRYDNLELLRALAHELSRSDRAQRLDYRHWSNIMSAVLMLKFKDEDFAKVIEKQISCK